MRNFKNIKTEEITDNAFKLIGKDWMLVTAGTVGTCNMMTASWGGVGVLWNMPVAYLFIRPQRYTDTFIKKEQYLNLCFFEEKHRDVLKFCGAKSGRDVDKVKETGLTLREGPGGSVWFDEAKTVLQCRKLYAGEIEKDAFIDKSLIAKNYEAGDFHHFYIVEIVHCLIAED